MVNGIDLSLDLFESINKVNLFITREYKIHNSAYIVQRLAGLLCRIIITLPIGLLLYITGWIFLLVKFFYTKKANKIGDQIIKKLILEYNLFDLIDIQNYLDNNFVFGRVKYLLKKDRDFQDIELDSTKTILIKKELV